jgi:pimeloyl-ACP methyl ester carboxylesterase
VTEELNFVSGQHKLVGNRFSPTGGQPSGTGILFIHGRGSDQSGYARRAAILSETTGAICLTFDLSGHGRSGGSRRELSPRDHLADSVAAFDTLVGSIGVDETQIGVCGASYGAYLAALLIAHHSARSLLLRAPALYPDTELDVKGADRLSSSETCDTAAALRNLSNYDRPVLILRSEHDEVIPNDVVEAYVSACRHGQLEIIPHAGHRLADEASQARFIDILVKWFQRTLLA